jgi:hypothetical protein
MYCRVLNSMSTDVSDETLNFCPLLSEVEPVGCAPCALCSVESRCIHIACLQEEATKCEKYGMPREKGRDVTFLF